MAYSNGVVSVGTATTLICTPGATGAWVQNLGGTAVYLGGPGVTAGTAATGGVTLPPTMTSPVLIPSGVQAGTIGADLGLYGRMASGTSNVAFLCAV